MKKSDVVTYFGSAAKVARALNIARSSVSGWGVLVPEKRAAKIERMTSGALKYEPALYEQNRNTDAA
ncbi:hypothetical protein EYY95_13945 [Hafnia alvei]|jgi:DNA-binding transcriptional regulator YdaS (Cro superfamily)|uniref:Cro/CI family transcriptional regulator n=1 Tax=Hafnia alvei TaxID=569 RepID=UPI0007BCB92B|nr:Cro/CI family transcriptional regulator [Hafnia alvei]ANC41731.1 hypothetical protein A6V27_15820 [Hafnia alvei]TBL86113.1 hypothetical protein EYY95_13945 [Hafnia alvei]WNN50714.1 Cro/CI family transcriptional regulator [Hafnia alvei]